MSNYQLLAHFFELGVCIFSHFGGRFAEVAAKEISKMAVA